MQHRRGEGQLVAGDSMLRECSSAAGIVKDQPKHNVGTFRKYARKGKGVAGAV